MDFIDLIIKKRNKETLTKEEINFFVQGVTNKTIPDYQISAMLMAICINSLNEQETSDLTVAMINSGKTLDLSSIDGFKIDKHSTGGVSDTTTLIVAPLVASLGLPVIKLSGRGLGHTGGTIDKLESIPGFNVNLSISEALEKVKEHNLVLMSQTEDLAPADKYMYALRDVTGTVESMPLIASSIMSKKIASGSDGIVLDIKCGKGAFMKNLNDAKILANEMIKIGQNLNKKVTAIITNMETPLGMNIGNSLEVIEAIEVLKGNLNGPLKEVSLAIGAQMLIMSNIAKDTNTALEMLNENINNKKALYKFEELIRSQGGNPAVIHNYSLFPQKIHKKTITSEKSGYVTEANAFLIGEAAFKTGAGRLTKDSKIDYGAGIMLKKQVGDKVEKNEILAIIFAEDSIKCENAGKLLKSAIKIENNPLPKKPLIYDIIK